MAGNFRNFTQQEIHAIKTRLPVRVRWICWVFKLGSYLTRRNDGTVNRSLEAWLLRWLMPLVPASETPNGVVYTRDAVIDSIHGVWVRVFIPVGGDERGNERLPVVVYFHGGGFCMLSPGREIYDVFCRRLAGRRRVVVVSVGYRLSPEHKFPAAYADCYAALAWLKSDDAKNYLPRGADLSRCFLMGDSAGGNIVHHVGCRVAEGNADLAPVRIAGHVLIQPYFGGEERTAAEINLKNIPVISVESCDWWWKAFLPEGASRDHPAANVVGPNAPDISGLDLPPSLVVIGGLDVLQDWQLRYWEHLKKMEKVVDVLLYENGVHGFPLLPYSLSSKFLDDISYFFMQK